MIASFENANFGFGLVLNNKIPFAPWAPPLSKLPGVQPLGDLPWLMKNEAYDQQIALKKYLHENQRDKVFALSDEAGDPARELAQLLGANSFEEAALSHQEDFCLLEGKPPFRLLGAFLAFPAGWRLEEKLGRTLWDIHIPVDHYPRSLNDRVERMMGVLRADMPLWRSNCLRFDHPNLHSRDTENIHTRSGEGRWLRSERQVLKRLPKSGVIVFSILTYILDLRAHPEVSEKI